jgi:hypothetical protein
MPVTQPSSSHAQHDALLIAKLAANDVNSPERVRANALVAECPDCAELLQDLQAITVASRALPAPARSRDFRLTEADAARLRRSGWRVWLGSGWRAWLESLAAPRFAFMQRAGAGLVAIGIAGLLFASIPGSLFTGGTSPTLGHLGAPLGTAGPATDSTVAAPNAPGTAKNGAPAPAQPITGGSGTTESITGDQSAAPSAAGGALPQPAPTAASLSGPTAPPAAGSTAAPAAAAALPSAGPTAAPSLEVSVNGPSSNIGSDGAAAPTAAPAAPAVSAPPTPKPTGAARGVPQGVSPTSRTGGSESGLGLSPLALVSIVLFGLGLGLFLARRMAVALTNR